MALPPPLRSIVVAAVLLAAAPAGAAPLKYPDTPKRPVVDTYQGVKVTDDYRWLEQGNDPAVRAWSEAQLRLTRATLDTPLRARILPQVRELVGNAPYRYFDFRDTRGGLFAMKSQPPKNQPSLVLLRSPRGPEGERVLLDLNALDAKGTTAMDFYAPSLDGHYVAVVLSEKGSEDGSAHVIDARTGERLADVVPRVNYPTGGGSIAWDARGTGFYYTRYPQGDERPKDDVNFFQQVWFHKLGTPASADAYVIGKEFPRIAETHLESSRDGAHVLASVANGDGGEYAYYLGDGAGRWTKVADFADRIRGAALGRDGRLYVRSLKGTLRGRILAMPLDRPVLAEAKEIVPEGEDTIESFAATPDRLYVSYMVGGPSELRVFDLSGKALGKVPTEPISDVRLGETLLDGDVLVRVQSFVTPPSVFLYSARDAKLEKTRLAGEWKVRFDDAEVVREMAASKDGTKVPVNILMKKGTRLDGRNPVLLYAYGGYGVSTRPWFSAVNRLWLDHGGILATVNVRGGGEFGEAWHLAGNLTKKQNVFADMLAAAEHMVLRGYTHPSKLAAQGGSNGGLLMGAILTQRPDLFRAIVSHVGLYDMLRVELTPNGAFNVTEFGTVKDPAQFKALYAYSPYHRVKDGVAYPAVLLLTGENDGRVDPYNSRKMAARLQAANASDRPILLRVSFASGHGIGTGLSERVEQTADVYTFLFQQLGMPEEAR
ncbi:MAG: prolyl oligopeptidase family serine peptidase [Betaproteobacteria bacterium]